MITDNNGCQNDSAASPPNGIAFDVVNCSGENDFRKRAEAIRVSNRFPLILQVRPNTDIC